MCSIKLKVENDKKIYTTKYSSKAIIAISYKDIVTLANIVIATSEKNKKHFSLIVTTKNGNYKYNNINNFTLKEYYNFISSGIEEVELCCRSSYYDDEDDYWYIKISLENKYFWTINVDTSKETDAIGLSEKIKTYLTNLEVPFSKFLNIFQKIETLSLWSFILIGIMTPTLRYIFNPKYILCIMLIIGIPGYFWIIKNIFYTKKVIYKKEIADISITKYIKSEQFKQHLINTITTVIITSIVNYFIYKIL